MDNTINSDLIRGHINTIILKALYEGDRYGYDIIKDIEQKSSGQYTLKQPTLYSCLKRLESQGFINSYWGAKSNGGRRKYYALTEMGRELFLKNQTDWEYSRTVIDKLISDKTFDLATASRINETETALDDSTDESNMTDEEVEQAFNDDENSEISEEQQEVAAACAPVENETPEYLITVPPETEEDTNSANAIREAMSTADIMNRLFEEKMHDSDNVSYAEKLRNETYTPSQILTSSDYFTDFPVDEDETAVPDYDEAVTDTMSESSNDTEVLSDEAPAKRLADIFTDSPPTPYKPFYYSDIADPEETQKMNSEPVEEQTDSQDTGFYSYHNTEIADEANESEIAIQREYRNILSDMFQESEPPAETKEPAATAEDAPQDSPPTVTDKIRQRNFEQLENSIKDLGDGITIRTHNSKAAKEYTSDNYYYSNKLMLYHYGFLFGITVLEMVILFLFIRVGLGIKQLAGNFQVDLLLYGLAIVGTLVFPIVAAILNFKDPDRRKRINFNLKGSLIFRISLTVICGILVYLINLFCGMQLTGIDGYVPSLFIPWVLCLNFPISALIFRGLYASGKFSVD